MTPLERQALDFIETYIKDTGVSPTYREILSAIDRKSMENVSRIVASLERQGVIRRARNENGCARVRCIELVEDPWRQVGDAADNVLKSIKQEYINKKGKGAVLVDAEALGDLDVALAEARARDTAGAAS